jgi:ATP-dependent Zn protease
LIDEGYTRALAILRDHRAALDRVAAELARAETVDARRLQQIFST